MVSGALVAYAAIVAAMQPVDGCRPAWVDMFPFSALVPEARAITVFDDGSGPAVYAGGLFTVQGAGPADFIARWDGGKWSQVGEGITGGAVLSLLAHDDGTGPALYASNHSVWRWDGRSWTALGDQFNSWVRAMCIYDDGSGPALYSAGSFKKNGDAEVSGVARWDGAAWVQVGTGFGKYFAIMALAVFDPDGAGPGKAVLVAAGGFTEAGGKTIHSIAQWDGGEWSALGPGLQNGVRALLSHEDGSGPALYAGGDFTENGAMPLNGVARWDGREWSPVGSQDLGPVYSLAVHDGGGGPAIVAGCTNQSELHRLARFDGENWEPFAGGVHGFVYTLHDAPDGSLLCAGKFYRVGPEWVPAFHAARYSEGSWTGLNTGIAGTPRALGVFDDGSGPALHAAGELHMLSDGWVGNVGRWDGRSWSPLGQWPEVIFASGEVRGIGVHDHGAGPRLHVCGPFKTVGGVDAARVAQWENGAWAPVGDGIQAGYGEALATFDAGDGPALYIGGTFGNAGRPGQTIGVKRFDGLTWQTVGIMKGDIVYDLAVFDGGEGPELYAGGTFFPGLPAMPNGMPGPLIARFDGERWRDVGGGFSGTNGPYVGALHVFDDGSAPALYASGRFSKAGQTPANNIARWDGLAWTALGEGIGGDPWKPIIGVRALADMDDGGGRRALYAGGGFAYAGGLPAKSIARWDGQAWSALGAGVGFSVLDMAVLRTQERETLFLSGGIVGGIAVWQGCEKCYANCNDDYHGAVPRLDVEDFLCFQTSFAAGDAYADCDGNGTLDAADFLCFQLAFALGC